MGKRSKPMSVVVESVRFKVRLFDLLGKTAEEVVAVAGNPSARIDGEKVRRFLWMESATDETGDSPFPVVVMARLYDGRVWAVGIRSDRYFFALEDVPGKEPPGVVAVPKKPSDDPLSVNWIVNEGGALKNLGVTR
ncbi:MAG: hypothetical protein HYY17_10420 [Planctomycetes bacterium]|nr:hypothetical protein [Planctomycetota bacterium]